ncbi:alpha/beta hydrolase [Candidatus Gracilibacteria bacterium]|nr:alpha/beta hydrolase [Candidatus Gracilibacteria bacterium]
MAPRNRAQPTGASLALAFAVFRANNPAPDPVVYLSGGPGGAALAAAAGNYRSWRSFAPDRDFIFVDQRGTGVSWPGLYCPELRGATSGRSGLDAAQAEADALLRCSQRFAAQGVAMADFNSAASAADLDLLRAALGYERWNLFGISYGTRLAVTMLRDNPASIRSVVLDSPYPPHENLYTAMPATLDQSLRTLFTDCATDARCNAAYPELENVFYTLIARLNAQPQPATLYGSSTMLSGDRLIDVMFRLFLPHHDHPRACRRRSTPPARATLRRLPSGQRSAAGARARPRRCITLSSAPKNSRSHHRRRCKRRGMPSHVSPGSMLACWRQVPLALSSARVSPAP